MTSSSTAWKRKTPGSTMNMPLFLEEHTSGKPGSSRHPERHSYTWTCAPELQRNVRWAPGVLYHSSKCRWVYFSVSEWNFRNKKKKTRQFRATNLKIMGSRAELTGRGSWHTEVWPACHASRHDDQRDNASLLSEQNVMTSNSQDSRIRTRINCHMRGSHAREKVVKKVQ